MERPAARNEERIESMPPQARILKGTTGRRPFHQIPGSTNRDLAKAHRPDQWHKHTRRGVRASSRQMEASSRPHSPSSSLVSLIYSGTIYSSQIKINRPLLADLTSQTTGTSTVAMGFNNKSQGTRGFSARVPMTGVTVELHVRRVIIVGCPSVML